MTCIPGLIHELLQAVKAGNLTHAMAIQARIDPLKDAVYGAGEPTGEAHANMKAAMVAAGIFKSGTMRPPTVAPSEAEIRKIEAAVAAAGLKPFVDTDYAAE
jgi:4-hydroxy-tetrahydrodipicolinate synthase